MYTDDQREKYPDTKLNQRPHPGNKYSRKTRRGPFQFPPFLRTHETIVPRYKARTTLFPDVLYGNGNSSPSKLSTERCATVRIYFTPEASLNSGKRGSFNSTCRSKLSVGTHVKNVRTLKSRHNAISRLYFSTRIAEALYCCSSIGPPIRKIELPE